MLTKSIFRLDCLQKHLDPRSFGAQLIEAAEKVNKNVLKTDNSLFNKFLSWESNEYHETRSGVEVIQKIARSFLEEKIQKVDENEEHILDQKVCVKLFMLKMKFRVFRKR